MKQEVVDEMLGELREFRNFNGKIEVSESMLKAMLNVVFVRGQLAGVEGVKMANNKHLSI